MKQKGPLKMEVRVGWRLFDWLLCGAGKSVMNDPPKDDLDDAIVCLAFREVLTAEHLRSCEVRKVSKRVPQALEGHEGQGGFKERKAIELWSCMSLS